MDLAAVDRLEVKVAEARGLRDVDGGKPSPYAEVPTVSTY